MKCMKCGTTIAADQVFCDSCQEDMERYPVKPGTPILLPNRVDKAATKSGHKKAKKPEEIIASMRVFFFWLLLLIVALITALAITISLLLSITDGNFVSQPVSEFGTWISQML